MDNRRHIHHSARHVVVSYPISYWQRIQSALAPIILVLVLFFLLRSFSLLPIVGSQNISPALVGSALLATFLRLLIAYVLALVCSLPLALLIEKSPLIERILFPLFDVVQSIPVLAFFPIVILFFLRFGFVNGASIFIIFVTMLFTMVFSLIGGLKVIPNDIKSAAHVFKIRGFALTRRILLPAIVPYLVTGSLLTWAQGWNIIIVAEVLHTYIPGGTSSSDLFGIGSILVNAAANGQNALFFVAILAMIGGITVMNFLVWQKLLHYAERFKFE
jgi:NitT/TauT family transport system permease protein